MDDTIQQLKNALRCPCCWKKPSPNTSCVGMCENGHMTCETCALRVMQDTPILCPVCRQPTFKAVRGHCLAVSVIEILTALLIYSCRYPRCVERKNGREIGQHEATCRHKPVACLKPGCAFSGPVYEIMDYGHASCLDISIMSQQGLWCFSLNLSHVYSCDLNEIHISSQYKPIVLRGVTDSGYDSRAYIDIKSLCDGIVFYSGWLDNKLHTEEKYKLLKIQVFVYINTEFGEIGNYVSKSPLFEGEQVNMVDDGVYISKGVLYNWLKWTKQYRCHECKQKKAHVHFRVKFIE